MPTIELGERGEVHLPEATLQRLRIAKGEKLDVHVSGDVLVLVPSGRIPKGQRYFWTEEWQRREREADEAIASGEVLGPFTDADEAIEALHDAKI